MRNMSFALTTEQIMNREKTVTRRFGWKFLKPGDRVCAVEKGMGLKKGEKVNRLAVIEIVSVDLQPLTSMTKNECMLEGFPDMKPAEFEQMIRTHYKRDFLPVIWMNRIEFRYPSILELN